MIQKRIIFKRKLRGMLATISLSFLLFGGICILLFGIWFLVKNQRHILTPLPKLFTEAKNTVVVNRIEELCITHGLHCTSVTVHADNTAIVSIDTNEEVTLSLQKDLGLQIASLQVTTAHLTIEGKRFSRLDFRFDKPVISY